MTLSELPNLGSVIVSELKAVGIVTPEHLRETGAVKALYQIRGNSSRGCFNMLYALEGAIQGIRWHNLSKEEKEVLKRDLDILIENSNNK